MLYRLPTDFILSVQNENRKGMSLKLWSSIFCSNTWTSYNEIKGAVWKVSKYGVFSGLYFPVFGLNTGKYGPGKTPYLDTFHAVRDSAEKLHLWFFSRRNSMFFAHAFIYLLCQHDTEAKASIFLDFIPKVNDLKLIKDVLLA